MCEGNGDLDVYLNYICCKNNSFKITEIKHYLLEPEV